MPVDNLKSFPDQKRSTGVGVSCSHITPPHSAQDGQCKIWMWAAPRVKTATNAADTKWSLVSNFTSRKVGLPSHPHWPQPLISGDYKNAGHSWWRRAGGERVGWCLLSTEAGLLTFTGGACFVVLLSNHTESSCVRCITAARYATYGMEKSELDNPGRKCSKSTLQRCNSSSSQKSDRWYDALKGRQ